MSKTPFFVSFVCPRSVTLSILVYWIYDLSAKDLCEKHAQWKVVLQHKSALFTQGGSSGSPQNELGSHPPTPTPSSVCHPVSQLAPTCYWKSQSTLGPLSPQTAQHDSAPISLIKPHPGTNTFLSNGLLKDQEEHLHRFWLHTQHVCAKPNLHTDIPPLSSQHWL